MQLTPQQQRAISCNGRAIVSASAGSGKTFVMIRKLVDAILDGTDLDCVLAVTFTKKAAAQMKEKLRSAIIERMADADKDMRTALKVQLAKIPSANISTIHSFCARLLRTYFYAVGIDGTFDIISDDDYKAKEYMQTALDSMFERYYDEDNAHFKTLLACYRRKRGDTYLKNLILESYAKLRVNAGYVALLDSAEDVYTEAGFEKVCEELNALAAQKYRRLEEEVIKFATNFSHPRPEYGKILADMINTLENAVNSDIFAAQLPLTSLRKPTDRTEEEKQSGAEFKKFKDDITARYKAVKGDICGRECEKEYFLKSGRAAIAFAHILKDFDAEYTAIKCDENKLDYNDLEHLTLALLHDEAVRKEIGAKYTYVFVDEYQDVNPVQEEIISLIGGANTFLVGDVKQAIYGFRGSKSLFFAEKYNRFLDGDGSALRLSNNFRSSDGVISFVNKLFSQIMTVTSCGFDYSDGSMMERGGKYPEGYGTADICVFGKEEDEREEIEVYSVKEHKNQVRHTREGLAVLELVKRELKSKHYDLKTGEYVDTQPGDICILTRKRNKAAEGIVRVLTDAGYSVAGAQESNILTRPEVRQMMDILSYIDNTKQDIPLATALLSPLGNLSCDELAAIRITAKGAGRMPFRDCCKQYLRLNNSVAAKLKKFYERIEYFRGLAEVFSAAQLIDKILEDTYLEAAYSEGGGEKLKNLRRLAAEGTDLSVAAFLAKFANGYEVSIPSAAASDSIKIMTMHASKGLEFPVVIIADICATYRGKETNELPLDEQFGFAPKYYDAESMLIYNTLLRRLTIERTSREELKNELNLFYVACTRAMCNLHILAEEVIPYSAAGAAEASSYAKLFDMSLFLPEEIEPEEEEERRGSIKVTAEPDEALTERISKRFMRGYAAENSVNLPVKSSASAILKQNSEDVNFRPYELFSGEGETGTERGTAYHRFLQLCDFSIKDAEGIRRELAAFVADNSMSEEQVALVDADDLASIISMPVFSSLDGATTFREREFLCTLPANQLFDTDATDGVLVQGAIDLLAQTREGYRIIDYKYSHKSDAQLIETYSKQLALYKKAVAVIMKVDENSIGTAIVNIFRKSQITL